MDTGCLHPPPADPSSSEASGDTSSACGSASASASQSTSARRSRGVRLGLGLRLRRRRQELAPAATPGGEGQGGAGVQVQDDLALPLGMSFAAVVAQVVNTKNPSGERLQPALLSKICTSAVKESLRNIYGNKLDSFMRNFEKSFNSTLTTLHLVNEMLVYGQGAVPQCSSKHEDSDAASKLSTSGPQNPTQEIKQDLSNSVESQLVLCAGGSQQLTRRTHSISSPEADQRILNAFERSLKEQTRSNELKEFEISLSMRKLQLKQSQLELNSYSHMLDKIKLSLGFQKASFQTEKFKTQMQDTRHAQIMRTLIDFLVSAVIIMSVCFGYGTYTYSYQRITDITAACSATSRGSKSWWVPNSVSNFNSGLLFIRCHVIAATRMFFGIVMILAIVWLAFQRSAVSGSSMPVTFNIILLGVICGFAGRFCTNTLGGDGNMWLICWEVLCSIHLLGNCYPSVLYRVLHGPISVSDSKESVWFPYWIRRWMFYAVLGFFIPALNGLLPFASLSDWNNHFTKELKSIFIGEKIEA
ncbi:protein CPR-5-like isoform X1 [Miscanthus floridulus]|uniref:protein CPR-5-like isoform X1 n=1 Tax=Miscanthus floridulus TaxID=154761 RepID=UPI00345890D2